MTELSLVVLAHNEQRHIVDCLHTLQWGDELLVVDDFSTDDTPSLAQECGARVVQHKLANFADQRDHALAAAQGRWVFFVDADERATPALAAEIRQVIQHDSPVGWWVPRRNIIMGRWMRGAGWSPDFQLRLMRRDLAHYDPQHPVHELVLFPDGSQIGHLENPLTHYNYDRLSTFIAKQDRYATLEAQARWRQGLRTRPHNLVLQPLREFRRRYVSLKGYQDGALGLLLCLLLAYYDGVAWWRLWRLTRAAGPAS
ncbi:MAG: glycosyltransferase family 2 protein [Chloroflexi bacterium]|nr:glycosyltransferase family 2 protein [Chloroflexota bacterium]MBU1752081.1 glycosyltransferase family 2 protein [Chloroflexota bacterium]MBU1877637.1 glycosyltransferase family 2 protein [Chloroflexota bacterium]